MPERKRYFTQLAGEYLTAGELFRQEIFACVTFGSAKSFDIVALGKDKKMAKIEVKTSRNSYSHIKKPDNYPYDNHWQFNIQAIKRELEDCGGLDSDKAPTDKFYVLVALCGDKPDYYVFEAQMVYTAFREKINEFKEKTKGEDDPHGLWDLRLSKIWSANKLKDPIKKDDWSTLKKYLNGQEKKASDVV